MRDEAKISVIICAYTKRRWDSLHAALESVRVQHLQPLEIIVVIDHNPDLETLVSDSYPDVRTIPNGGRRGLSAARNTGISVAHGAIVAFLDDDAFAPPDWLARMAALYADESVVGVGGRVTPIWPGTRPRWFPEEFGWVVGCSYRGQPEHVAAVRNFIGCNMSFRRTLFGQLGGFEDGIGREGADASGCEETEFCIRAREASNRTVLLYDPSMEVYHRLEPERATWRYFRMRCRAEGRSKALVVRRHGAQQALSSERRYTMRVLPTGVLRGLRDAVWNLDHWGLARAGAIMAGLASTAGSYLAARYAAPRRKERPAYSPIQVLDVELDKPLSLSPRSSSAANGYKRAFCLLRLAGRPVAVMETSLDRDGLLPADMPVPVAHEVHQTDVPHAAVPARTSESPFISVVIATHDRTSRLATCLDSLLRQDYSNFDIIVVDNAPSSRETADLIANRYAPTGRVRYVREDVPGLGRAHNRGLAAVVAPIVAFTDDDVIVDPRWLTMIASQFARNDAIGCVTGLILPAELETRAQYWAERHGGFGKGFEPKLYDLRDHRRPGRLYPYAAGQFGSGANMAFRTDVLRRIGGFDAALGAGTLARGGDDLDAFFAVIQAGCQLAYEPGAIVWHHHRAEEAGMRRQAFGYGVGLGAYLTKLILQNPGAALRLSLALPEGLAHIFGRSSPKNRRLADDYPTALVWRERLGILAGIPLYLLSRAAARRATRPVAALGSGSFSSASE